jgi:hypothetical protein
MRPQQDEADAIPDKRKKQRDYAQQGRNGSHSAAECHTPTTQGNSLLISRISREEYPRMDFLRSTRYYWLLPAEGHLHRRLFGQMLRRILALPVPSG